MGRIHGYFNAAVTPNELRTVAALQRHGGRDHPVVVRGPDWGLGTNVTYATGDHPARHRDARITAVHDGEFYNHDELREHLRRLGHPAGLPLLASLYAAHGDRFVERLDGAYAIALIDTRDRTTLVLATDVTGTKSIYYRWDPADRCLHFSSDLPALLGFRAATARGWEPALDRYLATGVLLGEQTVFEEINVLPPGTVLRCPLGGTPTFTRRPSGAGDPDDGAEPEAALRAEVHRMLGSRQPVAVVARGGTATGADATVATLAAIAGERRHVHTFTLARPYGDRPGAPGVTHHRIGLDQARIPELVEDVVWYLGQPDADPAALSSFLLFAAASEHGFPVVLTGEGAGTAGRPALESLAVLPQRHRLYTPEYRGLTGGPRRPFPATGDASSIECRLAVDRMRRVDHLSMARSVVARFPYRRPGVARSPSGKPATGHGRQLPYQLATALMPGTPLWSYVRDILSPSRLRAAGQLEPDAVDRLLRAHAERPVAATALAVWALLVYEVWREQFHGYHRLARLALTLS